MLPSFRLFHAAPNNSCRHKAHVFFILHSDSDGQAIHSAIPIVGAGIPALRWKPLNSYNFVEPYPAETD